MGKGILVLALAAAVVVISTVLWAAIEVKPDKENVVASRLEGNWVMHVALTKRLLSRDISREELRRNGRLAFKLDAAVAEKIPAKYDEFLAKKQIYAAGIMTRQQKEHAFLLIENSGNPHIVYFREDKDEPMGDAESFNVMLAPAKEPINDLLFVGGDFNNQPFKAYERAKE